MSYAKAAQLIARMQPPGVPNLERHTPRAEIAQPFHAASGDLL